MRRAMVLVFSFAWLVACGGESESGGTGGSSGAGGSGGATGGSSGTGGATGGNSGSGGATGGSSGSGAASGGAAGAGGSTGTCVSDIDCVTSVYTKLVTSEAECYCPMCPTEALGKQEADARATAWIKFCSAWEKANPCPVPPCVAPLPLTCVSGTCAFKND